MAEPRVLHVLEALEGGTSRHLIDVVTHARGVSHEVVIPARRVGGLTDERAAGALAAARAVVHTLAMRRTPWAPANAKALLVLRRLVDERQPDILHGHSSIGGLLARLPGVGRGRPLIYTPNGVTTVRAGLAVERALGRRTDRFVAVSESEGELAVRLGVARPQQVTVIPNGIDLVATPATPFDLRGRLGIAAAAPLVGTIARLVPQKAPEDFVAACATVAASRPDAHFVLIGGGPLQALLDSEVARHGLGGRFHQLEALAGAAGILDQLDVFALASRFEGGPYAPLEALRAGVPVALTAVVGSRDVVVHEESGLLAPPADPAALGASIVRLLDDDALRGRLVSGGPARLEAHFNVVQMGARLTELYASVAAR